MYEILDEAVESFQSDTGREVKVLVNPTRLQFQKMVLEHWRHGARCVINNNKLYACNAYDVYHYQMIAKLGLNTDEAICFTGYNSYIGVYPAPKPRFVEGLASWKATIASIRSCPSVVRVWGADVEFKIIQAD